MVRLPLIAWLVLATPLLSGCIVGTAVGVAGSVAATGVKAGAKVGGAVVGVAADGVGTVGHAVTGGGRRDD